jgi:hypothetical protein
MARKKSRGRKCSQDQRWLNTRLSEDVNSLTATVTALELEGQSSPTHFVLVDVICRNVVFVAIIVVLIVVVITIIIDLLLLRIFI